jgi:exodeoxyribonuclease V gamma subunit
MTPIFLAETPLRLLERMAGDLAGCRDPWVRHWLVLPGKGRGEWVQRHWAEAAGIASHSQIVDVRSLVEQAGAAGKRPFSIDRLTLAVAEAIPGLDAKLPLPEGSDPSVVSARVLAWSRQLAEALDVGLLCRAEGNAPFLRELACTPGVGKELSSHLGQMDDRAFGEAAAAWLDEWKNKCGIPKLWIHLDAGLPLLLMHRLRALLDLLPDEQARLYLLAPSNTFWGDQKTGRRRCVPGSGEEDAGPVLRALGRSSQDLHNQAVENFLAEGGGGDFLDADATPETLLGRLQESSRLAAPPESRVPIREDDASLTVHDCRSPLRELEVCRDRVIQALQEDGSLAPHDILLLLADPKNFAPLVTAAFQPHAKAENRLPVRMPGLGGAGMSQVADSLARILGAMGGRIGLPEIQALVEDPLVAEKFGFDQAGDRGSDLVAWLKDAQFRWGFDEGERAKDQGEGEHRWSLAFALRRLALGAAVAEKHRDGIVDGAAPLDRARGLSVSTLASLAQFAERLWSARNDWSSGGARDLADWCGRTQCLCEEFLGTGNRQAQAHRAEVLSVILPGLRDLSSLKITSDAWLRLLKEKLDRLAEGQAAGGGGITVADLRHYAGTPARMILIAGLGSESFPRREERPTWHPLAGARHPGDPDRRDADRHALLLALLASRDRLVLTYQGGSDTDDKRRPPSTPLADLLTAVDLVSEPNGRPAHEAIHFRHGLNGCSPQSFAADVPVHGRSRLPSEYAGARRLQHPHREPYSGLWAGGLLTEIPERTLRLKDLSTLLEEPCRLFLQRLGLRLPEEEEELESGDLLMPDTLHAWNLRNQLLIARLENPSGIAALKNRLDAAGDIPRGKYGEKVWADVEEKTPAPGGHALVPLRRNIEIKIADSQGRDWLLKDTLPAGWYAGGPGHPAAAHYFSASKHGKKRELKLKLELLCLALSHPAVNSVAARFSDGTTERRFKLPPAGEIPALLTRLVDLYALARRLPLPFWPDAYEEMVKGKDDIEAPEALLNKAREKWDPEYRRDDAPPPSCEAPATRFAFRGLDDPFFWKPDVPDISWLPASGQPLAWRLGLFIREWESGFPPVEKPSGKSARK